MRVITRDFPRFEEVTDFWVCPTDYFSLTFWSIDSGEDMREEWFRHRCLSFGFLWCRYREDAV